MNAAEKVIPAIAAQPKLYFVCMIDGEGYYDPAIGSTVVLARDEAEALRLAAKYDREDFTGDRSTGFARARLQGRVGAELLISKIGTELCNAAGEDPNVAAQYALSRAMLAVKRNARRRKKRGLETAPRAGRKASAVVETTETTSDETREARVKGRIAARQQKAAEPQAESKERLYHVRLKNNKGGMQITATSPNQAVFFASRVNPDFSSESTVVEEISYEARPKRAPQVLAASTKRVKTATPDWLKVSRAREKAFREANPDLPRPGRKAKAK